MNVNMNVNVLESMHVGRRNCSDAICFGIVLVLVFKLVMVVDLSLIHI